MSDAIHHWIVYAYIFPNRKKYIGKTKTSLAERQGRDFIRYRECPLLWKAIQKYGVENIDQVILVDADIDDESASRLERNYIAIWHTNCNRYYNPSFGYNLTDGGDGMSGWKMTEEQYEKRCAVLAASAAKRRGVPLSAEHVEKMRCARLGKPGHPTSEETKRKISIAISKTNLSPETRRRRSKSAKRKMYAINNETGDRIDFDSVQAAADHFGIHIATIQRHRYRDLGPIKGYNFYYLTESSSADIMAHKLTLTPEVLLHKSEVASKKMYAVNEETGDRIDFNSVKAAADYFGVNTMTIYRHRNKGMTPIKGYKFYYLSEDLSTDND